MSPEVGMIGRIGNENGITPPVPQFPRPYDKIVTMADTSIVPKSDVTRPTG
ncbi:hypothetical protein Gxy13693_042_068 [Komagataeibacter xylinus NBRC 13693]|uniref:Uncharacterized protein n=1 Tax=Komagataeibacter xylinus NBRC 13693 TaxID=1234668 RepID=A0A0D6QA76_KOMXY|nr:hypothetical protein Gxy13693_042_068 [Komagataeibacter xylinus NBRC 13693]